MLKYQYINCSGYQFKLCGFKKSLTAYIYNIMMFVFTYLTVRWNDSATRREHSPVYRQLQHWDERLSFSRVSIANGNWSHSRLHDYSSQFSEQNLLFS